MDIILDNTKKFEDIAEKRSVFYHDVDKALELVREFIKNKNRILYGGMAIDISLKLSGHEGIYTSGTTPDFDFMSPDYYNDSNELAILLAKAGFENVSSIHAIHLTSRRVRVNFIPVADITYIPQNIYDSVPTLEIPDRSSIIDLQKLSGIRIVHPNFQRLDIYRALSTPLEKPPGEVILQRTKKDIKRFRMLNKQYPLFTFNKKITKKGSANIINKSIMIEIPKAYLQNAIAGGFLAYAFMYKFWKIIAIDTANISPIPLECLIHDDNVVIEWPKSWKVNPLINIITDHPLNLADKIKKDHKKSTMKYYNKYLDDLRPRTIVLSNFGKNGEKYELFDNYGRESPVFNLMKLLNVWFSSTHSEKTQNIYICQSYYVLLYFLLKSYEYPEHSEFYISMHNSMFAMIADVETIVSEKGVDEIEYDTIPFFLTNRMYGEANWSPDYMISTKEKLLMLQGQRVSLRGPFGFYPKLEEQTSQQLPPIFDPLQGDELFLIDGKKREKPFESLEKFFDI
jgi:hypothetical protein